MYRLRSGMGARGLGYDYYDVLREAGGLLTCDPHDSACVARNTQVQAAAEDIWVANMNNATAGGALPQFTVTPEVFDPSPTGRFFQNVAPNPTVQFVGQAAETLAQVERTPALQPIQSVPIQPKKIAPRAPVPTPTQSSVPADLTASFVMPDFSQGFTFSAVPWWMWAGGAAAAWFLLKGGR
jgi:hypothetical protein